MKVGGVDSHDVSWLLSKICSGVIQFIQKRRWNDAIRCLKHQKVEALIESGNQSVPTWVPFRAFLLAMAQWGSGEPPQESCAQALFAYKAIIDYDPSSGDNEEGDPYSYMSFKFYGSWFQDLSLLHWGAGDIQEAAAAQQNAVSILGDPSNLRFDIGISSWTFQESTVQEYRHDCEEMRRMIRGEPVRPAFLGPPR